MSIVRGVTNAYGPGTVDIQIEQGANFSIQLDLTRNGGAWDITNAEIEAHFSSKWSPGGACYDFTVTKAGSPNNRITISYPATSSEALALPFPPQTSPRTTSDRAPRKFLLGGWILNIKESGGTWERVIEGDVYLDRDPCLT